MPVPYKVTFDNDGSKCPRSIIELRNKPECGVLFREDQPFKPHNRFPLPKNFDLRSLDIKDIPKKMDIPQGIIDPSKPLLREDPRRLAFTEPSLPQDENKLHLAGRAFKTGFNYERIPNVEPNVIVEDVPPMSTTYTHQDTDRVILDFDDILGPLMRRDMLVDPLEEPPLEQPRSILRTSRIRLPSDPRDGERVRPRGMTSSEFIEEQIQQLKRKMPPDTHEKITKVVEQEMFPVEPISEEMEILKSIDKYTRKGRNQVSQRELDEIVSELTPRGISLEKIMEVVDKYNAFDPVFEKAVGAISESKERAFLRRMKAVRQMVEDDPALLSSTKQPSYGTFEDSNLLPKSRIEHLGDTNVPITEGDPGTSTSRRFTLSQEASYYARRARNLVPSQDYTDPEFNTIEETSFESTPATVSESSELGRRLKLEALGVREKIVKAGKKLFAQEYKPLSLEEPPSFEMSDTGAMELRIPETNVNLGNLRDVPVDPFQATIARPKTKLSFAERIRAPTVSEIGEAGVHTVGGLGSAMIVSHLLSAAKVNKYVNAFASGMAGDVGGRIMSNSAKRIALRTGLRTTGVETLTARGLFTSGLKSGGITLIAMPLDNLLNNGLRSLGYSHTLSNMVSTGTVSTAAIMAGGAEAAPETYGMSFVMATLAVSVLELQAFITGQDADAEVKKINEANKVRSEFIDTLPNYDYNFDKAFEAFDKDKKSGLNVDSADWPAFKASMENTFTLKPKPIHSERLPPIPKHVLAEIRRLENSYSAVDKTRAKKMRSVYENRKLNSGLTEKEEKVVQSYFGKYVLHNLIKKVCSGNSSCNPELLKQDKGELTDEEKSVLNEKTDFTWQSRADMQVNVSMKEMEYTQKRVQSAKEEILNNWDQNKKLPEQMDDKSVLAVANIDPNFKSAFDNAVKLESQRMVVDAFYKDQTKMENLPENIQKMANLDKDFYYNIHIFYEDTEKQAAKMNLSVPQLIQLQGVPEKEQTKMYRQFQFDYAKMDTSTVNQAQDISKEEDTVREAGYYDIDQAYLSTDPTAVGIWKPTDSQILQAHSAGMTLQQYVNYMHELSKGEQGDFSNLPKFDKDQIRQSGILDFSHFQDELQLGGFDKNLYSYNPETLSITLRPGVSNIPIPSTQNKFVSKYTPENIRRLHQETADLLHGLDEQNQGIIDTYNTQLRKHLSVFGENYNKQVASINDNRSYHGINNLLVYDENAQYEKYHMEFKPAEIKTTINNPAGKVNITPIKSGDNTMAQQSQDDNNKTITTVTGQKMTLQEFNDPNYVEPV